MSISLDPDGNIQVNPITGLSIQVSGQQALEEQAMSECRCEQNGNFADPTYGRDALVWKLSQSNIDRVADIKRIIQKYYEPNSISAENNTITVK
ncbi:MAG: hypothetical protein JXN64_06265 [Spirochaetes bacterium]|nr:hypothetical protein [Spirochaetota bacterium]